ncbi:MAG: carboxypeptidase regulatory-like domain-containing protein [Planctomycetes bacterium]|nr:carboxypeptidase regulatory-like domain-containing protein [Planctomycetota bacterium]
MSARSAVVLAGAGLALAGAALVWLLAVRDAGGSAAPHPSTWAEAPVWPAPEILTPRAPLDLVAAEEGPSGGGHGPRSGRAVGVDVPAPDALRSVRGRVLDAQTREPLPGFHVRFLSRRPQNVTAVTDERGEFLTERELASGVVAVSHLPDLTQPRYAGRHELEPGEFLLPKAGEGAPAFVVELQARVPRRLLEVDVRGPDGLPASDASVSLSAGRRDERGTFTAHARDFEVADLAGRARFALFGEEAFQNTYRVEAEKGGTLVSEAREIDPPLPLDPERLDLYPGAVLRVRVRNDEGRPVPGVSLWLSTPEAGRFAAGRRGETDAEGEHHFTGLRATCWTVSAVHPWTGDAVEKAVDLAAGEYADAELRLSVRSLRLGAQGLVLDERGDPVAGVAVNVQASGSAPVEITTDASGRFQYWGLSSAGLLLGFGGGFLDDRFDPALLSVPFGATGLLVRRVERRVERAALIEVVDAETKLPCARAAVWLARPETASLSGTLAVQRFSAPSGVASLALPLGNDTRYAVDAPGYLRAEGELADLLERARDGRALRVELRRGFEREVEVRDRITRALLSDAVFFTRDAVVGATDGAGRARLASPAWPGVLRVECTGYVPLAWDPIAAGWPGTVVWLDPVRAR